MTKEYRAMSDLGRLVAGRYRLVELLGRGGMGTVWRADDEMLGRLVAVKRLHPPHLQSEDEDVEMLFERTRREARSAARISHPNVVVVHDVVEDEGLPSIVLEYVPAITLGDLLKERGSLTPVEAARIGREMIAALRAAHAAGVLHRDVKPGNVLLSDTGRVVLTDFGIAQASGMSNLTRTGELIGSIDFLAPERLTGGAPGPAADLWSLGVTLFQAVEGRSPFRRNTAIETAYAIATDEIPVAGRAGPLGSVIAGLLVREPERRLSADETERMLHAPTLKAESGAETVIGSRGALTSQVTGPLPASLPRWRVVRRPVNRRGAPLWITISVVVAALAGGGLYVALHFRGVPQGGAGSLAATPAPGSPGNRPVTPATASSSGSYSPPPLPARYHLAEEPDLGLAIPVPNGWKRKVMSNDGRQLVYVDPSGLVGLRVASLDFAGPDPLLHLKDVETQMTPDTDAYKRLRMQNTQWRGRPAAIWEFTFQGKTQEFHAIDIGFGQPGEREITVYLSAPSDQWADDQAIFDTAVAGLRLDE
ncbi:serine/threonine-protein kinase [Streptomyces sp. NPDC006207]